MFSINFLVLVCNIFIIYTKIFECYALKLSNKKITHLTIPRSLSMTFIICTFIVTVFSFKPRTVLSGTLKIPRIEGLHRIYLCVLFMFLTSVLVLFYFFIQYFNIFIALSILNLSPQQFLFTFIRTK